MFWLLYGIAIGALSAWLLVKFLPRALEGKTLTAPLVVGGKLFVHLVGLAIAALAGKEALLWAAAGDLAGLAGFLAIRYLLGRRR